MSIDDQRYDMTKKYDTLCFKAGSYYTLELPLAPTYSCQGSGHGCIWALADKYWGRVGDGVRSERRESQKNA